MTDIIGKKISRKNFLLVAAAAGTSAVVAGCSNTSQEADASSTTEAPVAESSTMESAIDEMTPSEILDADVVVVGGGWSGLAAATEAIDNGASVVVFEKAGVTGGAGVGTEGMFGLNSTLQKDQGIDEINADDLIKDEQAFTHYTTDYWLYKDYFQASGDNIDWMVAHGAEFGTVDDYQGMGEYPVFHWWKERNGMQAMESLASYLTEKGADIRLSTPAVKLVMDNDVIAGVIAQDADGNYIQVNAPAVIFAGGGLAGDIDLARKKSYKSLSDLPSPMTIGSTGDTYKMAAELGASDSPICLLLDALIPAAGTGSDLSGAATRHFLMMVNKSGNRFMREDLQVVETQNVATNGILAQNGVFNVFDQDTVDLFGTSGVYVDYMFGPGIGATYDTLAEDIKEAAAVNDGSVFTADTLEDLAEQMGVDIDTFVATVERYNSFAESGVDEDFGCGAEFIKPLKTPPFTACLTDYTIHKSIGGFKVNRDMQVVNLTGDPITGLYSAGTDSCGLYTDTYNIAVCGAMSGFCCYSGRTAAKSALGL